MKKQIVGALGNTREPHVLDEVRITERKSWQRRLRDWHSPMSFDDRVAWLHINYEREGNGPEQFIFYLELADRYGDGELFRPSKIMSDSHVYTLRSYDAVFRLKTQLSRKAFAVLCTNFFAEQGENRGQYPYALPYQQPLFGQLLWFFRPYGGFGGFDNLRPSVTNGLGKDGGEHYVKVARNFAKTFVLNAWDMLNRRWYNSITKPDPQIADPHAEEIIRLMRHLNLLDNIERGQHMPRLNIFLKMVCMMLERHEMVKVSPNWLDNKARVRRLLLLGAKEGNPLATALYAVWPHVYDQKDPCPTDFEFHSVLK